MAGERREAGPTALQTEGSPAERRRIRTALRLLGASPTARWLLDLARRGRFAVRFDRAACRAAGAKALTDERPNRILLDPALGASELVTVLAHELAHVPHFLDDLCVRHNHGPAAAIAITRLIEADALAKETQIAFELGIARARPARGARLRTFALFCRRHPQAMRAFLSGCAQSPAADGRGMAEVVRQFYRSPAELAGCEDHVLSVFEDTPDRLLRDPTNYRDGCGFRLAARIRLRNRAYLREHAPEIDPLAARCARAVDPRTDGRIRALIRRRGGVRAPIAAWLPPGTGPSSGDALTES